LAAAPFHPLASQKNLVLQDFADQTILLPKTD